jgi:hypothetical protein
MMLLSIKKQQKLYLIAYSAWDFQLSPAYSFQDFQHLPSASGCSVQWKPGVA